MHKDELRDHEMDSQVNDERYSSQLILPGIGQEGQRKLGNSTVVVVGCGALGCTIASALVRAGVGHLRIIDRDFVEIRNLQRQILFTEADAHLNQPKAVAAERALHQANSQVQVEGVVADFDPRNALSLVEGANLLLDGLDNFETRYLLNDVSWKTGIPWIYGGAVGTVGMTATFIPDQTPCFRCFLPDPPPPGSVATCDVAGVINSAPWMIASVQAAEAMKMLIGTPNRNRDLIVLDPWNLSFQKVLISTRENCPTCQQRRFDFLEGSAGTKVIRLCGQNAVQIWNAGQGPFPLDQLEEHLCLLGKVTRNEHLLQITIGEYTLVLFYDGRAVIRGTDDVALARSLYARYIGI
ncbi:MAG: ThiF family adenylyltransferase [Coprothermobacterota bacterium]|nr:ThiF family adenylyltransferase [Coprothermobacterota bacterium]